MSKFFRTAAIASSLLGASVFTALPLVAITTLAVSCTSIGTSHEMIVERSAKARPAWAEHDFSEENASETFLVYKRGEVYRLDLGIKQAQAAALRDSKRLVFERAKLDLVRRGEAGKLTRAAIEPAAEKAISAVSASYTPPDARQHTVYWELVRRETPNGPRTYYDIYVLLTLPRDDYGEVLGLVIKKLQESPDATSKQLAQVVLKSYEPPESREVIDEVKKEDFPKE